MLGPLRELLTHNMAVNVLRSVPMLACLSSSERNEVCRASACTGLGNACTRQSGDVRDSQCVFFMFVAAVGCEAAAAEDICQRRGTVR